METHNADLDHGFAYMETQMEELSTAISTKASTSENDELRSQLIDL